MLGFEYPCYQAQLLRKSRAKFKREQRLVPDFLAAGTESDSDAPRTSGSTVEKHDHAAQKGILFFQPSLIIVEISSSLWRLASFIAKTGTGRSMTIDFLIVV